MTARSLARFAADAEPTEIASALATDGGAIVEGLLDDALATRLADDFSPHLDAVPWCNTDDGVPNEFHGHQTKRLHGLLSRSPAGFAQVVTHPLLATLCREVLAASCRDVRVSTGELMHLGPGQPQQVLHRDADSWLHFPRPRPEILLSANVALTDFTEHNGATVVVPGSHLWDPMRKATPEEEALAVMPRGSALLYTGNVLHGGGANESDGMRTGMYVGFCLSWIRPLENHLVTNGSEAIGAAPPRVQELLGVTESGFEVAP